MSRRWLLGIVLVATHGCGWYVDESVQVGGQVRYDGRPLSGGVMAFAPDQDKGGQGEVATGVIQADGTYQLDAGAKLKPGWYRLSVAAETAELPEKFQDPLRSGLSFHIKTGESGVVNLDLR